MRIGYATVTICRFWRLKLISPSHPTTALKYFRIMSACIAFATAISLYSAAAVRIVETVENEWGVVRYSDSNKRVNSYRNQDMVLGVVCFMMVHACNLLCDVLFAQTIFSSVRRTADKRVDLSHGERLKLIWPYVPPATVTSTYLFCSILGIIDPHIEHVLFFAISVGRLAPVIESWTFYAFAINHTRLMLKNLSKTGSHSHSQTGGRSAGVISAPSTAPRLPPALAFSVNASHSHSHSHAYSNHKQSHNSSFSNSVINNTSSLSSAPPGYEQAYQMSPVSPRSTGAMSPTSPMSATRMPTSPTQSHHGHGFQHEHPNLVHYSHDQHHYQHEQQQHGGGHGGHGATNPARPNIRRFS
ncbi:hypothetical protein BCR44DRAFT_1120125 [Catenaria anguillulae PL171]|uniref:Uncharacterized protein n=1 Tax=Catenaria anguillulae PL171 TaxID=765915 RepID=A0A1Y2HLJ9_9FUNG|nr:hypothetical protein BCR44DRAFT_1120125 [Catenaria anguillulae PL171]